VPTRLQRRGEHTEPLVMFHGTQQSSRSYRTQSLPVRVTSPHSHGAVDTCVLGASH